MGGGQVEGQLHCILCIQMRDDRLILLLFHTVSYPGLVATWEPPYLRITILNPFTLEYRLQMREERPQYPSTALCYIFMGIKLHESKLALC